MSNEINQSCPYLIKSDDASGSRLFPLSIRDKAFQEEWLQELIYIHPSILPVEQIDETFSPLISIGREIANIDNLFISPSGLITIVETKLWRNPDAHRIVVSQILDYANTLAKWTYAQLDSAVVAFMERKHGKGQTIYQLIRNKLSGQKYDEIELQQNVQNCLENGRFALLIVGDKIFPAATQLGEMIQSAPHLQYSIGFVELRCYKIEKGSNWPLIVIPRYVTRTKEITRAVVKVIYEEKKPEVEIIPPSEPPPPGHTNLSEFIASLPSSIADIFTSYIENWIKSGYTVYWGQVGFSLRVNWKGKLTTVFDAYPSYAGVLGKKRVERIELPVTYYEKYKEQLMKSAILGTVCASATKHIKYVNYDSLSEDDVTLLLSATDKLAKDVSDAQHT